MEARFPKPKQMALDLGPTADRIRTAVASYVPAAWSGANTSGHVPVGQRVLVQPDMPEETTVGGIHWSPQEVSRNGLAAVTGVLVAVGESAFGWSDGIHPWAGRKPLVGERIVLEAFAGQIQMGADGRLYRLMESRNVGAILEPTAAAEIGDSK